MNLSLLGFKKIRGNKLGNKYSASAALKNLSKVFDCIPHDLLVAKRVAYGCNRETVAHIYSYLENSTQYVRVNSTRNCLENIMSAILQGSMLQSLTKYLRLTLVFK